MVHNTTSRNRVALFFSFLWEKPQLKQQPTRTKCEGRHNLSNNGIKLLLGHSDADKPSIF